MGYDLLAWWPQFPESIMASFEYVLRPTRQDVLLASGSLTSVLLNNRECNCYNFKMYLPLRSQNHAFDLCGLCSSLADGCNVSLVASHTPFALHFQYHALSHDTTSAFC